MRDADSDSDEEEEQAVAPETTETAETTEATDAMRFLQDEPVEEVVEEVVDQVEETEDEDESDDEICIPCEADDLECLQERWEEHESRKGGPLVIIIVLAVIIIGLVVGIICVWRHYSKKLRHL